MDTRSRSWPQLVIGLVLSLMGLVWALQGVGVLGGSVMSGKMQWLWIGLVVLLGGLWLTYRGLGGAPRKS